MSLSKSLIATPYLFLNAKEKSIYSEFENYCDEKIKKYISNKI